MPPPARPMRPAELLIVIAEDDDTYAPQAAPLVVFADKRALPPGLPPLRVSTSTRTSPG